MSAESKAEHEVVELLRSVADAVKGIPPWSLPQSVLGRLERTMLARHSEYSMFRSREVGRTARYLTNVMVPSMHRRPPSWVPSALRNILFHETTVQQRPDQNGSYDSCPSEEWFFINGILTDSGMAAWNADYLAEVFYRPFTIIQNATDGPISDLIECASERAFGMNGEPADIAFPEIYRALKDPAKERIVVVSHSQGTLIAAVLVRLLRLRYEHRDLVMTSEEHAGEVAAVRRAGVTLELDDFEPISVAELKRLEIYCFANCASEMRYVDPDLGLPWIESLGNEHDLVARLGMLAPNLLAEEIEIDGPLWVHRGAWGHLLNAHYLAAIQRAHSGIPAPGTEAAPFEQCGGAEATAPRLFGYLNGATPGAEL